MANIQKNALGAVGEHQTLSRLFKQFVKKIKHRDNQCNWECYWKHKS